MARREIDERAARHHIPKTLVTLALGVRSPNGLSYAERLQQARTERALSEMFEDFIATVPLGRRLFADLNPVRTGGPMQVGIAFAESHVKTRNYPFPLTDGVRQEVFTRRGGLYSASPICSTTLSYDSMLYRFADFNAGHYASRNAAFQKAVSSLTEARLAIDGDLLREGSSKRARLNSPCASWLIASDSPSDRSAATSNAKKHTSSRRPPSIERTVFELADERGLAPRALVPNIRLQSVKITRNLTTEWFARRVDETLSPLSAESAARALRQEVARSDPRAGKRQ